MIIWHLTSFTFFWTNWTLRRSSDFDNTAEVHILRLFTCYLSYSGGNILTLLRHFPQLDRGLYSPQCPSHVSICPLSCRFIGTLISLYLLLSNWTCKNPHAGTGFVSRILVNCIFIYGFLALFSENPLHSMLYIWTKDGLLGSFSF